MYVKTKSRAPGTSSCKNDWLTHPDAFHTGIYRKEECIKGCLNVNKYHKAFKQEKAEREIKIIKFWGFWGFYLHCKSVQRQNLTERRAVAKSSVKQRADYRVDGTSASVTSKSSNSQIQGMKRQSQGEKKNCEKQKLWQQGGQSMIGQSVEESESISLQGPVD